jgi:integrase
MASIAKRDKGWRAQVAILGVRESRTFSTKAKAVAWAGQRETEIRQGKAAGVALDKTCGDAFRRYVKEVSSQKAGRQWESTRLHFLGRQLFDGRPLDEIRLVDLTPAMLGAWRDQRLAANVAGSTINRDLGLISNVFTVARREWKWIAGSPTTDVRRPKDPPSRERLPTPDEIDRICLACGFDEGPVTTKSQAVAVAFLFAIETGMRAGEICKLRPEWISENVAHLPASVNKNGFKRDVPLSRRARELLDLLPDPGDGPRFGISEASLDALFRKARTRAGVEGLTFHDTRHLAITRLAKKLGVLDLARMVGHRDLRMLQIYYNESAADIATRLD